MGWKGLSQSQKIQAILINRRKLLTFSTQVIKNIMILHSVLKNMVYYTLIGQGRAQYISYWVRPCPNI